MYPASICAVYSLYGLLFYICFHLIGVPSQSDSQLEMVNKVGWPLTLRPITHGLDFTVIYHQWCQWTVICQWHYVDCKQATSLRCLCWQQVNELKAMGQVSTSITWNRNSELMVRYLWNFIRLNPPFFKIANRKRLLPAVLRVFDVISVVFYTAASVIGWNNPFSKMVVKNRK